MMQILLVALAVSSCMLGKQNHHRPVVAGPPSEDRPTVVDSSLVAEGSIRNADGSLMNAEGSFRNADGSADEELPPLEEPLTEFDEPLPESLTVGDDLYSKSLIHIDHRLVKKWIRYFTKQEFDRFQRFLDRGEYYRVYIEDQLASHSMPQELYYLAMIESGFRNRARSRAHAVGIWQFMRGTARNYGLLVDGYIDQRMDPVASTSAAISYLQDLHRVYQSWWLAIAAYNSGEVRVLRAIMHRNTRDFFELIERRVLPRETVNYVPKFIAAMYVAKHHRRFGFRLNTTRDFDPQSMPIYRVPPFIHLREVAKRSGCSLRKLKKDNPYIIHSVVHPTRSIAIRLPDGCRKISHGDNRRLIAESRARFKSYRNRKYKGMYRVRAGDTLSSIARKFKTSVKALKLANNLRSDRIRPKQRLYVSPPRAVVTRHRGRTGRVINYRVRAGDSLYTIAQKHRTSVNRLKRDNKLRGDTIHPRQTIRIYL